MYSVDNRLKIEDFIFSYGELDKKNKTRAEKIKSMLIHAKEMKLKESLVLVKLNKV